jgi:hypothetical protein
VKYKYFQTFLSFEIHSFEEKSCCYGKIGKEALKKIIREN